jgi:L-alanine-DL-glutamate epimerase-like enolase superfamily enzyme
MTTVARAGAALLRYRLDAPVGGSGVSSVDVVLVDLEDADGVQGLGFSYVLAGRGDTVLVAAREQLAQWVASKPLIPPPAAWRRTAAGFNRTGYGPNNHALAAIDVAMWDLHARRRGVPLAEAMGGEARAVPVYGSGGFTARQSASEAAAVAARHAEAGFGAVKPRMRGTRHDAEVLQAVRDALPPSVHVMADANEKCDLPSARWLLAAARDHQVLFVEEPLPGNWLDGYRALAKGGGAAVATGEHLQGVRSFLPYAVEGLAAMLQPDLSAAGGLTPILEVGALCDALGVAMSPHFLPGLFVHVAAASPAVTWLEDFPLLEPLFDGWPVPTAPGTLAPRAVPGHGLTLMPDARSRFGVDG